MIKVSHTPANQILMLQDMCHVKWLVATGYSAMINIGYYTEV